MDVVTEVKLERIENDVETMRATDRALMDTFYRFELTQSETRDIAAENRTQLERVEGRLVRVEGRLGRVEERLGRVEERLGRVEGRLERLEKRQDRLVEVVLENRALIEQNSAMIEDNRALIEQNGALIRTVQLMLFNMCDQMGLTMEIPGGDPEPD